jgi:hypothetical protein
MGIMAGDLWYPDNGQDANPHPAQLSPVEPDVMRASDEH